MEFVAGVGHTSVVAGTDDGAISVSALGPFVPGQVVEHVELVFGLVGSTAAEMEFSAGISGSGGRTLANLNGAGSLIERSDVTIGGGGGVRGLPTFVFPSVLGAMIVMRLAVGLRVLAGAEWIVWGVRETTGSNKVRAMLTAFVVGRVRGRAKAKELLAGEVE